MRRLHFAQLFGLFVVSFLVVVASATATAAPSWGSATRPSTLAHHTKISRILVRPAVAAYVPAEIMQQWNRVAICEEGGNWHVRGSRFSGGLGITNNNWVAFGGTKFAPNASLATPQEQVVVARRIQPNAPDQYGCSGSW